MSTSSTDPAALKKRLREQAKAVLRGLDMAEASRPVVAGLLAWPRLREAPAVAAYWPLPDEVDLRPVLQAVLARGAALYLPRWRGVSMDMVRVRDLDHLEDRPVAHHVIKAPGDGPVYTGGEPLLMLVPALMMDRRGYRLGRGAGVYDRYLEGGLPVTTVGVVVPQLLVDHLPAQAHDHPLSGYAVGGEPQLIHQK